jgi:hypothetical protein
MRYKHWGALPFLWQDRFLCAGGVLIHYVGDAYQPLHTSYLSQGDPDDLVDKPRSEGQKMHATGVHSGYEDGMVEYGYKKAKLMDKLKAEIRRQKNDSKEKIDRLETGFQAASALIHLIAKTRETLLPRDIVDKWTKLLDDGVAKSERSKQMWDEFGDQTIEAMARGTRYLAALAGRMGQRWRQENWGRHRT